jgi:hypothetical protein
MKKDAPESLNSTQRCRNWKIVYRTSGLTTYHILLVLLTFCQSRRKFFLCEILFYLKNKTPVCVCVYFILFCPPRQYTRLHAASESLHDMSKYVAELAVFTREKSAGFQMCGHEFESWLCSGCLIYRRLIVIHSSWAKTASSTNAWCKLKSQMWGLDLRWTPRPPGCSKR